MDQHPTDRKTESDLYELSVRIANPSLTLWMEPTQYWGIKAGRIRKRIKELEQDAGKAGQTESVG